MGFKICPGSLVKRLKRNVALSWTFIFKVIPICTLMLSGCGDGMDILFENNKSLSSDKEITSFTFKAEKNSALSADSHSIINDTAITAYIPGGTDKTSLVPDIEFTGISIFPEAGTAQNFTGSVRYTVTAEDKTTNVYTVTIEEDSTAPDVTIDVPSGTNSAAFTATITFSEAVTGFEAAGITLNNGEVTNINSASPAVYTAVITAISEGDVTIDIDAGAARDLAGNPNTTAAQAVVVYSSTRPALTISSIKSDPTNSNPVPVIFTFGIDVANFDISDITISSGNASAGNFQAVSASEYTADITPINPDEIITVYVPEGAAQDTVNGLNDNFSAGFSIRYDSVLPEIQALETIDSDQNGKIDHYKITLTEPVLDSSFPGYIDSATIGDPAGEWSVDCYGNARIDPVFSGDTANDNVIYILFSEGSSGTDTDAIPDLLISTSGGLSDHAGNVIAGVLAGDAAETDGAPPVIVSAAGEIGTLSLTVTFSEAVLSESPPITESDFTYSDESESAASAVAGITDFDGSDKTIVLTLDAPLESSDDNTDTITPSSVIQDAGGNSVLAETVKIFANDSSAPSIVSIETMDYDSDGKIDHYKVEFDEPVTDGTFPGYIDTGTIGDPTSEWTVTGYGNVSIDPTITADVDNDKYIYIAFSEGAYYDTGATPDLVISNNGGLEDSGGSVVNPVSAGQLDGAKYDKASPVIVSAHGEVDTDILTITFSEPVNSSINTTDFSYSDVSGDGAGAISIMIDADGSDSEISLVMDANFILSENNSDTIAAEATITDSSANPAPANAKTVSVYTIASEFLRPVGAGDLTQIRNPQTLDHWAQVDETGSPDGYSTEVDTNWSSNGEYTDLYEIRNSGTGGGEIFGVKVYWVVRVSATSSDVKGAIKTNGVVYETANLSPPTSYATYSYTWDENPGSGLAWTWEEVDSLQAGVTLVKNNSDAFCTQLYVEIIYATGSEKNILSFNFMDIENTALDSDITGSVDTYSVTLTVPPSTDVTALVPAISISGASISPESGVAQNFAAPITYTVTADDSSTKEYSIYVKSIETIRPNAPGDELNIRNPQTLDHWAQVDDVGAHDDNTAVDTVWDDNGSFRDLYNVGDPATGSGTITDIKITWVVRVGAENTDSNARGALKTNGTVYETADFNITSTSYKSFSETWTVNPATSSDWTWPDIDALQAGINLIKGGYNDVHCTQIFVEVSYLYY